MRKPRTWKETARLFGLGIMFTNSIILYIIFYIAFFANNKVIVDINYFGEANIEFIVLPLSFIFICYSFIFYLKKLLKVKKTG